MTAQPPYPPEGSPDQPPAGWGQAPPPAGWAQPPAPVLPYADWGSRALAYLLDYVIALGLGLVLMVPGIIGIILSVDTTTTTDAYGSTITSTDSNGPVLAISIIAASIGYLLVLVFGWWNQGWRQGQTGQSIGKKKLGIKVVRVDTGQVLGGGMGLLRYLLLSILGGACLLDFLWPLWDARRQTWHDMVVSSVVVKA